MNVSYVQPLRLAWDRMTRMLFRPFRIEVWMTLGFAAFLSEYLSWGFSGSRSGLRRHAAAVSPDSIARIIDFIRNPLVTAVLMYIAAMSLLAYLLFMWLSSRGHFIFLDNVAHERTGIVEPWRRFKRLGNSLFLFRLCVTFVCLVIAGAIMTPFLAALAAILHSRNFELRDLMVLLPMPLLLLPFAILFGYISLFTRSFVAPIMYRYDVGVLEGWRRFLALFGQRPLPFVVYGLYSVLLLIIACCLVVAFGLGSLGIGFVLMAIPYIGSVVLLPLEVTARALGPEFLAQFGPEYAVLDAPAPAPVPPAAAPSSAHA
jgi:hypothetical protein